MTPIHQLDGRYPPRWKDRARDYRARVDAVFQRELRIEPSPWLGFRDYGDTFPAHRDRLVRIAERATWWPGTTLCLDSAKGPQLDLPGVSALPVDRLGSDWSRIRRASLEDESNAELDFYELCDPFLFMPSAKAANSGRLIVATTGHETLAWYAPRDCAPDTPQWLASLEFQLATALGPDFSRRFHAESLELAGSSIL
jgi:hypothetical protein